MANQQESYVYNNALQQLSQAVLAVSDAHRGRIMVLWSIAFLGARPVGSLVDGSLAAYGADSLPAAARSAARAEWLPAESPRSLAAI